MENPWKDIALSDYESHMSLDSVYQLQTLNRVMKDQFARFRVSSAMILGIAGGNGLEHADAEAYDRIYGVDINPGYLEEVSRRYADMAGKLECLCLDLTREADLLPHAQLVIANLLVEYIGYDAFRNAVVSAAPTYVSCTIQINAETDEAWVSDSPYRHVFDDLERVYHPIDATALTEALAEAGFSLIGIREYPLPNGKKLQRLDYGKTGAAFETQPPVTMHEAP